MSHLRLEAPAQIRFTTEGTEDTEDTEKSVIPAKAGIHRAGNALVDGWIPAFAGMTGREA